MLDDAKDLSKGNTNEQAEFDHLETRVRKMKTVLKAELVDIFEDAVNSIAQASEDEQRIKEDVKHIIDEPTYRSGRYNARLNELRDEFLGIIVKSVIRELATAIEEESTTRTRELVSIIAPVSGGRDALAVRGFLTDAPDRNLWRLYLNIEFTEYIEFQKSDYIHHQPLSTVFNPLAGMMVWIARDARVNYTNRESTSIEARFLQGDISRSTDGIGAMPGAPILPPWPGFPQNTVQGSGGGCSPNPTGCYHIRGGSGGGCSPNPTGCPH